MTRPREVGAFPRATRKPQRSIVMWASTRPLSPTASRIPRSWVRLEGWTRARFLEDDVKRNARELVDRFTVVDLECLALDPDPKFVRWVAALLDRGSVGQIDLDSGRFHRALPSNRTLPPSGSSLPRPSALGRPSQIGSTLMGWLGVGCPGRNTGGISPRLRDEIGPGGRGVHWRVVCEALGHERKGNIGRQGVRLRRPSHVGFMRPRPNAGGNGAESRAHRAAGPHVRYSSGPASEHDPR